MKSLLWAPQGSPAGRDMENTEGSTQIWRFCIMLHVKTTLWSSHFEKVSCGRYWGGEGRTLGNWLAGWWFGWCVAVEVVTCLAYVLDRCVFCLFVILGVSEIGCFFLHIVHWLPRFRISLEVEKVSSLFLVIYQYIRKKSGLYHPEIEQCHLQTIMLYFHKVPALFN